MTEDSKLVLDRELRILSHVRLSGTADITMIEQQQFTDAECDLVLVLLASYPYHCPFADLLHAYTGRKLEWCQREVRRALEEGEVDTLMRPTRNVLSRCHLSSKMVLTHS